MQRIDRSVDNLQSRNEIKQLDFRFRLLRNETWLLVTKLDQVTMETYLKGPAKITSH